MTIAALLDEVAVLLPKRSGLLDPRREARWLLARVLDRPESYLLAHGEEEVGAPEEARLRDWVRRRLGGEPAHYIVGLCPFCERQFEVSPAVLIPRPETEMLVARALELPLPSNPRVLDVGTGCGCIAVTLALELPGADVFAADLSLAATGVAAHNRRRLGASVLLACGDLATHFRGGFDLVVANLPYVPQGDLPTLPEEIRNHEPHLALDGGPVGLSLVSRLLRDLPRLLRPGGYAVMEVGAGHCVALAPAVAAAGLQEVDRVSDLARVERLLAVRRP